MTAWRPGAPLAELGVKLANLSLEADFDRATVDAGGRVTCIWVGYYLGNLLSWQTNTWILKNTWICEKILGFEKYLDFPRIYLDV